MSLCVNHFIVNVVFERAVEFRAGDALVGAACNV
jgi:hypothetical protein